MRHFFGDFFSPSQTRALSFFIDWTVTALSTISYTSRSGQRSLSRLRVSRKILTPLWTRHWWRALRLCPRLQSKTPSLSSAPLLKPLTSSITTMTLTVTVTLSTLACESSILFTHSLTKPNPLSDVSSFLITSIILPPRKLYATLGISLPPPPPTCHPTSIFPHSHNWSPRAKWHNTNIMASTNLSYFAATAAASRSSTQSSDGWNDQNSSSRVVTILAPQRSCGPGTYISVTLHLSHQSTCWLLRFTMSKTYRSMG